MMHGSAGHQHPINILHRRRLDLSKTGYGWSGRPTPGSVHLSIRGEGLTRPAVSLLARSYLPDIEPGLAVRFVARLAARVGVTVEDSRGYFPERKVIVTGYPVRAEFQAVDRAQAAQALGLDLTDPVILVLGGSRGARSINLAVSQALDRLLVLKKFLEKARGEHNLLNARDDKMKALKQSQDKLNKTSTKLSTIRKSLDEIAQYFDKVRKELTREEFRISKDYTDEWPALRELRERIKIFEKTAAAEKSEDMEKLLYEQEDNEWRDRKNAEFEKKKE